VNAANHSAPTNIPHVTITTGIMFLLGNDPSLKQQNPAGGEFVPPVQGQRCPEAAMAAFAKSWRRE
jgi:hypothetical protein